MFLVPGTDSTAKFAYGFALAALRQCGRLAHTCQGIDKMVMVDFALSILEGQMPQTTRNSLALIVFLATWLNVRK